MIYYKPLFHNKTVQRTVHIKKGPTQEGLDGERAQTQCPVSLF